MKFVLLVLACHVVVGKVVFKPLKPGEAVSRDLENEAISEEESLKWLGDLHYKESDMPLALHLQCDGCWELVGRLKKELQKVDTKDIKAGVREIHDKFCTRMTGYLRLVLDEDGVALPKYGTGKKTAVFGGWPQKYLAKLCTAIFKQHPVEDLFDAASVLLGRVHRTGPNALDICREKYMCPETSYERRLNASKLLKATNYTVLSSTASDYHLKNMPPNELPVKMDSELMVKLRKEYRGSKPDPTDSDVLQYHRQVEEQHQRRMRHEKLLRAATARINREHALAERRAQKMKDRSEKGKDTPLIDVKQTQNKEL